MLGPYWVPTREDLITRIEKDCVYDGLKDGYSVIIDATNFKDDWNKFIKDSYLPSPEILIKDFTNVSLEECIARDAFRDKSEQVGEEVIRNMYNKYLKKIKRKCKNN